MSESYWSTYYESCESRVAFLTQLLDPLIWCPVLEDRGVFISRSRPLACDFQNLDDVVLGLIEEAITVAARAVDVFVAKVSVVGESSLGYDLTWPPRS